MNENKMNFHPLATIVFTTGQLEDEETCYINIHSGYQLFEALQQYYEHQYEELFGKPVFDVVLERIEYHSKTNGVDFKMTIGTDDVANAEITINKNALYDENAKKIMMMREILDFDPEAEYSLLRETFSK